MTGTSETTRVTVSLPTPLVEALDQLLARGGSRSAAVRQALEQAVAEAQKKEATNRFVEGYRTQPQTEDEFGWADAATLDAWAEQSVP